MNRRHTSLFLSATLAAIATITAIGCAEPVPQERQGSRTAKLLAPKAIFKAKASKETKNELGIVEWRVFRGQRDVVLTGYDAKGKAKKGVSIGFHSAEKGVKASLRTRVLDGTMFAARHEYGGSTKSNSKMSSETQALLGHAFRDARAIRSHLLPSRGEVPLPGTGTLPPGQTPLPQEPLPQIPGGAECGGNLMAIVMAAVQCIQQTGNTQMCLAAAQSAGSLGGACQDGPLDPGMPPYDPMGQGGPYDPCGGMGGYPGDPMGGMCGPIGGYPGDMGGYPGDMGEGGYPIPGGMDDPFGDGGGMCPSCGMEGDMGGYPGDMGGYPDDIYGDPMSGEPMGGLGGYGDGFGEGW